MTSSGTHPSAADEVRGPLDLEFEWLSSIDSIAPEHWRKCFGDGDVLRSYSLHRVVERSGLVGVQFHYLAAWRKGFPLLLPCFEYRTSLTVLAVPEFQDLADRLRRWFPGLLHIHVFVVGTPLAICGDLLGIQALIEPGDRVAALRAAMWLVLDRARMCGAGFVVVKEIPASLLDLARAAWSPTLQLGESLPTTFVALSEPGSDSYQQRLRTKYRVLMKRRMRSFVDAGLRWRVESDFANYAEAMHELYLQVLERSAHRFETLTPQFFRHVSSELGERSFALLCFQGERLVAFELFLQDKDWLQPIYLGMDYAVRDESALYFNCLYRIIGEAEERAYPIVQLGQTSYEVKAAFGAVLSRLYVGIYHPNPLIRHALRMFERYLFPWLSLPRKVPFRDPELNLTLLSRRPIIFDAPVEHTSPTNGRATGASR